MEDITEKVQEENASIAISNAISTIEKTTVKQEQNVVLEPTIVKEETYPIKDFKDNCKALGYKKEVVAGALFNCKKTGMTKTEFIETIKNFLGKKAE